MTRLKRRNFWLTWTHPTALIEQGHRMGPNRMRRFHRTDARLYRDTKAMLMASGLWHEKNRRTPTPQEATQ